MCANSRFEQPTPNLGVPHGALKGMLTIDIAQCIVVDLELGYRRPLTSHIACILL